MLLNLTPHAITIRTSDGDITIPPSGGMARVAANAVRVGAYNGIPVVSNKYGPVEGLVRDEQGVPVPCIVSGMVLAALPAGTPNVFAPATGATAIRENGQVVAVTELVTS